MNRRATMTDVAALAGVSLKTVSRVVNGEPGVSPDLVERVRRAVDQLDYRHNLAASNLRRGRRTQTVGVLLHDLRNEFAAGLLRAIEDRARSHSVAVLAASLDNSEERERELVADLVVRRVDGFVLTPSSPDQSYLSAELRAGLPVVAVDRPAQGVAVDTVLVDNAAGARAATDYLIARGHRRIACLTDRSTIWTAVERRRGHAEALHHAGIPLDDRLVVPGVATDDEAADVVTRLLALDDPPSALFTARNDLTVGAIRALQRQGLQRDIAVVGFDDFPLSDLIAPTVTVVAQDLRALGAAAADLLFERMHGTAELPRTVVLPTRLVARESGDIPPRRLRR